MKTVIIALMWVSASVGWAGEFELDLSRGYNNNVFLNADDSMPNETDDQTSTVDMQTQVNLLANFEVLDGKDSDLSVLIDWFHEALADNDTSTSMQSMTVPYNYYFQNVRLSSSFSVQKYASDSVDVLQYASGRFGVTHKQGDNRLSIDLKRTVKSPKDDSYLDYKGIGHNLEIGYVTAPQVHQNKVYINAFNHTYAGDGMSNKGAYIKAIHVMRHNQHKMQLGVQAKISEYEQALLHVQSRSDQQLRISYDHEYFINAIVQLYFNSSFLANQSNFNYQDENYNYTQWVNTVGTRFSF